MISARWLLGLLALPLCIAAALTDARAQSKYHLHRNNSTTSGLYQLKTAGPDQSSGNVQSVDLKAKPLGEYAVKAFDTQAGVPNATGTLPAGTTVTFTVWMKKTANVGTMFPRVKLHLNSAAGPSICAVTGTTALTTTLAKRIVTTTLPSAVTIGPSDRLYLWVGVNLTAGSNTTTFKGQLNVEGTLNGNYDSYIDLPAIVPPPAIASLNPIAAAAGSSVVISGTNFGASQGSGTVTVNGIAASPSEWSDSSVTIAVPVGATSGPVVVTAGGFASNGAAFTVLTTGSISGTVTRTLDTGPVSGALVEVLLSGFVVGSTTTTSGGTYSIGSIQPSTYQARVSSPGLVTKSVSGVAVTAGGTATVNVALSMPGTIAGTVLSSAGGSPVSGANIAILSSGQTVASTTTNGSGAYSVGGVAPGTYDVRSSRAGFVTETTAAVAVTENATTTTDFALDPTSTGQINYVYDERDQLVAVINQADEAAIYRYDSVGNLLSIDRKLATDVSIIEFTPDTGGTGSVVTIYGTGFGSTTAANAVTFNGVTGAIQSASATKLVVTVPQGSITGPVSVTSPNGNAVSAEPFVVDTSTPGGAPTIGGFVPEIGDAGSSVVVSGTNFDPTASLNAVFFNGVRAEITAVSPTEMTVTVPANGSGPISITTSAGTATSTSDFFVAPSENPTATIVSAQRAINGQVVPIALTVPNKAAMIVFDATMGDQVTYSTYLSSLPNWSVKVFDPNGYKIATLSVATPPQTSDLFVNVSGTYTIVVSAGAQTGTMSLIVNPNDAVPPDPPSVGGPAVEATTTIPGQRARISFSGIAGQRVVASVSSTSPTQVWLVRPNGASISIAASVLPSELRVFDINPLPESGEYALVVRPETTTLATVSVQLTAAPTLASGGPAISEVLLAGAPSSLTFTGTQGQPVSLVASAVTIPESTMTILNPDTTELTSIAVTPAGEYLFAYLPTSGTYTAVLDPQSSSPGTLSIRLLDASTVTGSMTVGGPPVTMNITVPGQFGAFTFSGTAGQRVTLKKSSISLSPGSFVRLYQPGGGFWFTQTLGSAGLVDIPQLPSTGTYTVEVTPDPFGGTGSVTLSLIADVAGSVTPGGAALPIGLPTAEQRAWITFAGTSGQQVTVRATGNSIASVTVTLLRPDGSQQAIVISSAATFSQATQTLPVTGTYSIVVDPPGTNTGNITISVTAP